MLKIALTGGIGSGKSTAAAIFAELGVTIIDADAIVHELLLKNSIIRDKIVEHFGAEILTPEHKINKKLLRKTIFSDEKQRKWLENLLHPLVYATIQQRIAQATTPYCIIVIPLLFETIELAKQYKVFDRILVIDVSPETQISRTTTRDHASTQQTKSIIDAQIDHEQRIAQANDVLKNDGSITQLREQIIKLHHKYAGMHH